MRFAFDDCRTLNRPARRAMIRRHTAAAGTGMSRRRRHRSHSKRSGVKEQADEASTGHTLAAAVEPDTSDAAAAERALRISEAKFAGIVAISADAIISVDSAQRIINFNRGAEQIFGWTEAEALGQPLDILLPHRYRETHRLHIERFGESPVAARRMGERQQIAGLRKSGEEFPAEASISKIDVEGQRVFTVVLRDITARRNAERAQAFLARAGEVLASSLDYETTVLSVTRLAVPQLSDWCTIYSVDREGIVRRLEVAHANPERDARLRSLRGEILGRFGAHPAFEACWRSICPPLRPEQW